MCAFRLGRDPVAGLRFRGLFSHGTSYNSPTTNFKLLSLFSRKVWLPPTEKHTDTFFVTEIIYYKRR
jgi:hypothetical protein